MTLATDTIIGLVGFSILAIALMVWEIVKTLRALQTEVREMRLLLHDVTRNPEYAMNNGGRVVATCPAAVNPGGFQ